MIFIYNREKLKQITVIFSYYLFFNMSSNGLQFTHSQSIDPLKRHCSVATIQSDPKGHFSTLIDQLRKQENFQNVLLQINNLSGNNLELLKFVSQLEGMAMFSPKPIYKEKDEDIATKERLAGNDYFKKGKINEAFSHYSLSILKAVYTDTSRDKPGKVITKSFLIKISIF